MMSHTCKSCGIQFVKPNNPNRPYMYCSYRCRADDRRTGSSRQECACSYCGQKFLAWPYEVKNIRRLCSRACVNKDRDQGKTPEALRIRTSAAYARWRESVFRRDDYTCQLCGQKGGTLNADHIKRFADYPELRLDVDNGRTLCVPCHLATDTFGSRKQLLEA